MLTMTMNIDALWASLNRRFSWGLLGVIGDAYGDQGDEVAMEFIQWCVKNRKRPQTNAKVGKRSYYHWNITQRHTMDIRKSTDICVTLIELIDTDFNGEYYQGSRTRALAYQLLLKAYRLRAEQGK